MNNFTPSDLDYLLSPRAIRERAQAIYQLALSGETHFKVNLDKLKDVAHFVTEITLKNYPKLEIPFHSRWSHFQVGAIDRLQEFNAAIASFSVADQACARFDLAIVSVLLDAGSGPAWNYAEEKTGLTWNRSEGLAVASFRMFMKGEFSSDPRKLYQADAEKLKSLSIPDLARGFQVSEKNPLAGLDGRLNLLHSLAEVISKDTNRFIGPTARPGNLATFLISEAKHGEISALKLLNSVLLGLGPIWPGRLCLGTTPLGDVWSHPLLGNPSELKSLIPFHKLSQWLTYSLIEPLITAQIRVTDIEKLTGLAEYRNGGLLLDRNLIELRNPKLAATKHAASSPLIIEWRALTVVFLDLIAHEVRRELNLTEQELPLAKVLEGGTWWAGRAAAALLRKDASPPLKLLSDGTVF